MNIIEKLQNINLHDAELLPIFCDYQNKIVIINLKLANKDNDVIKLTLNNFSNFSISNTSPWGEGIYVADFEVKKENNNLKIVIWLNSGDKIIVEAENIEINKNDN